MFIGHYGVSFAVKRWEPRIPLWLLFLAAQFLDLLWAPFIVLGIEQVRVAPEQGPANPLVFTYYPFSHGLLAAIFWSVVVYAVVRYITCREWPARAPLLLALTVLSHWVLDLITHFPDLPLWGEGPKVGLGLWGHPLISNIVEIGFLLGGIWLSGMTRKGRWGYWVLAGVLIVTQLSSLIAPPPTSATVIGISGFALYVIFAAVAWGFERRGARAAP